MAKKKSEKKPVMAFEDAIRLALQTPHMTRKQLDELRKKQKQEKKN